MAGQGEYAVDGEAEHAIVLALGQVLCLLPQVLAQRGHARVIGVGGRGGKHGGACQRGAGQQRGYLVAHGLQLLWRSAVGLGDGDGAVLHA